MEPAGFPTLQKTLPVTEGEEDNGWTRWPPSGGVKKAAISPMRPEPVIPQSILQSAPHSVSYEEDDN